MMLLISYIYIYTKDKSIQKNEGTTPTHLDNFILRSQTNNNNIWVLAQNNFTVT